MTKKLFSFLVLLPYVFSYSPEDSSYTDTEIGVGFGQYRHQDCNGTAPRKFIDAGFKIVHKANTSFHYGVLVSLPSDLSEISDVHPFLSFLYPDLAFDSRYLSLGTTGLRVGRLDHVYGNLSFVNDVPRYAGRGMWNAGIGIHTGNTLSSLWVGINSVPYQSISLALNPEFQVSDNRFLTLTGRYGESNGIPEYGLSLGLRIRGR